MSEESNNGAMVRKKQEYEFHRQMKCLFQTTTVTIKSGFEQYTKLTKINKNTNKNNFFGIKKRKPKDKVSYQKRLAKMKQQSLKATQN